MTGFDMEKSYSAQIVIYRPRSELWVASPFKIYIDGKRVGSIYNDTAHTTPVSPMMHSIFVKAGRYKSETLTIDLSIGQTIYMECGFKSGELASQDILEILKSIKKGIYLKEIADVSRFDQIKEILLRSRGQRTHKSILRFISKIFLVLCILGLFGFANGFLTAAGWAFWVTPRTELPLGDPGPMAVDSKGNIYLVLNFYYRIQKYSSDGIFLRGWPLHDNN